MKDNIYEYFVGTYVVIYLNEVTNETCGWFCKANHHGDAKEKFKQNIPGEHIKIACIHKFKADNMLEGWDFSNPLP